MSDLSLGRIPKGHFLDGRQVVWDSTTLSTLKTCLRKYELSFREDWVPKGENAHLKFGILAHKGREHYYKFHDINIDHDKALAKTLIEVTRLAGDYTSGHYEPWNSNHERKDLYHLLLLLVSYLDHYREDNLETYQLANGQPAVELSFKLDIEPPWMLSGHLDRVVRFDGKVYLTDLKTTTSTLNQRYFDQYKPNNQMALYDFAGQSILPDKPAGIIIDACQILADGIQLGRRIVLRNDVERQEWYDGLLYHLETAEMLSHSTGWPMNDTACDHYGGCPFQAVCSLPPNLRSRELAARFEHKIWDPTENR